MVVRYPSAVLHVFFSSKKGGLEKLGFFVGSGS